MEEKPLLDLTGQTIRCAVCGRVFTHCTQYRWVRPNLFAEGERVCRGACQREYRRQQGLT
jgi:hypothetical protein